MPEAARVGDTVGHSFAMAGMIAGLVIGAAVVALTVATAGVGLAAFGAVAGAAGLGLTGAYVGGAFEGPPTGALVQGEPTVLINGRPAAAVWIGKGACAKHPAPLPQPIAQGSESVFIGEYPAARKGDKLLCSAVIRSGSGNVLIGGDVSKTYLKGMEPEIPQGITYFLTGIALAGGFYFAPVVTLVSLVVGPVIIETAETHLGKKTTALAVAAFTMLGIRGAIRPPAIMPLQPKTRQVHRGFIAFGFGPSKGGAGGKGSGNGGGGTGGKGGGTGGRGGGTGGAGGGTGGRGGGTGGRGGGTGGRGGGIGGGIGGTGGGTGGGGVSSNKPYHNKGDRVFRAIERMKFNKQDAYRKQNNMHMNRARQASKSGGRDTERQELRGVMNGIKDGIKRLGIKGDVTPTSYTHKGISYTVLTNSKGKQVGFISRGNGTFNLIMFSGKRAIVYECKGGKAGMGSMKDPREGGAHVKQGTESYYHPTDRSFRKKFSDNEHASKAMDAMKNAKERGNLEYRKINEKTTSAIPINPPSQTNRRSGDHKGSDFTYQREQH